MMEIMLKESRSKNSSYPSEQSSSRAEASDTFVRPTPSSAAASSITTAGPTHEDRVASARERAQKRIAERMAAAGLKPSADVGDTLLQRQEREKREREERLKRAEEEDAKREQERQRRLADERPPEPAIATPTPATANKTAGKKPPPAPPSRSKKVDSVGQSEREAAEQAIRDQQEAQEAERKRLE